MPAVEADIARGTRDAETVSWVSATIAARYPNARDNSQAPAEGYFDDPADAATVLLQRGAFVGVDRDRFAVPISAIIWPAVGPRALSAVDDEQPSSPGAGPNPGNTRANSTTVRANNTNFAAALRSIEQQMNNLAAFGLTASLFDNELGASGQALFTARVEVDLDAETTSLELFG